MQAESRPRNYQHHKSQQKVTQRLNAQLLFSFSLTLSRDDLGLKDATFLCFLEYCLRSGRLPVHKTGTRKKYLDIL